MSALTPIRRVIVYRGHEQHPLFGPYRHSIEKRIEMFEYLNHWRSAVNLKKWAISTLSGEELTSGLKGQDPKETLLVIPAGESTKLDAVFTQEQCDELYDFFSAGGRGYLTCGAAYWASKRRVYRDLCEEAPENSRFIEKRSRLPLFEGVAFGPLCPYPGKRYLTGFYSDAVTVTNGNRECTPFLGGGGAFSIDDTSTQKVRVLARYLKSELLRVGKKEEECDSWAAASIAVSIGQGSAILSMFHPYYGKKDILVEEYERAFPNSGTNWRAVKERLSPLPERIQFVYELISQVDSGSWCA